MSTVHETSLLPGQRTSTGDRERTRDAVPGSAWRLEAAQRALVGTVLCFAAAHVAICVIDGAIRGDHDLPNLFTLIEAHRLWPALALDASARWWSLALGVIVYGTLFSFAALARRSTPLRSAPAIVAKEVAEPIRLSLSGGVLALVAGLGIHMGSLAWIGRLVPEFPPVPDVLHAHLPY